MSLNDGQLKVSHSSTFLPPFQSLGPHIFSGTSRFVLGGEGVKDILPLNQPMEPPTNYTP